VRIGFFDPLEIPHWLGPPENVVPGLVALELLLVHNERMVVWIPAADAYRTGVMLHVDLRGRQPARPGVEAGAGTWRFGVQFADGQKATTLGLGFGTESRSDTRPSGPQLRAHGGASSGRASGRTFYRQSYWLWPLPPPGELLIACEWPNVGLELTMTRISADQLRDAAARSRELWPPQELPGGPGAKALGSPARTFFACEAAPTGSAEDADELVQVAERALFDAEEAYRLDPSDANQRRLMQAWSFVRRARDQRAGDTAAEPSPAADD
jgi:hypothetical protein